MDTHETTAPLIESSGPTDGRKPSEPLRIVRNEEAIQIAGEIDLESAPFLTQALADSVADPELVLDLREVTFMDSSGIHVLLDLSKSRAGLPFVVLPSRPVLTVLQLTGLDVLPCMEVRPVDGG